MGWGQFKPLLTDTAIAALEPIQKKYREILDDPGYLDTVLKDGQAKANEVAQATLNRVKAAMGYSLPGV